MGSPRKSDRKAMLDIGAWLFNIVTSVGIIMVNKALMATHGFTFATSLTGMHFVTTTLMTVVFRWFGLIQPSHLPMSEVIKFAFFANLSIVGMNVSLMWNSVGFYQAFFRPRVIAYLICFPSILAGMEAMTVYFLGILFRTLQFRHEGCYDNFGGPKIAKLCMIPASCLLEVVFDQVRYSRGTKLSIMVVLVGVAVCTVSDVSVNAKGLMAAVIAVWSTCLQQYYVHFLQKKYALNSFNLLGHTAPVQAASLVLLGPFVDFWLTGKRIDQYNYALPSVFFITLSCLIAVGTNLSQFICIGRFSAVSFQVLGHMKTIFVLILGFLFFGKEGLNMQVVLGMIVAICGMVWYGNASSKPGGKERRPHQPQRNSNGFTGEKDHDDEKV